MNPVHFLKMLLLPAAPFLLRRKYLIVVPKPLPAVLRPVQSPLPAASRRCRSRRRTIDR
jgi:hypothetical protein